MKCYLRSAVSLAGLLLAGLASILAPHSALAQGYHHEHGHAKRLVADYVAGSKFLTPPYGVAQIPFHKLTHIIHASIPWGADGSLAIADGFVEPELIRKAHAAGVKVMLLTGGDFGAVEANPAVMDTVVANLKDFLVTNKYDGLDVDWEFPETDTDFAAFVELMAKLRAALPSPRYTFSIDVAPWNTDAYDFAHLKTTVDFFNVMMYDCAGPWTSIGQLNSPIFWDPKNPKPQECEPGGSVQEAADIMLKLVPAKQINMGTPFYGYLYSNVTGLFGACPNAPTTADGDCDETVSYVNYGPVVKKLINKQGWRRHYDKVALVPYLVRKDGSPGFITYDDEFSTYARVWYSDWGRGWEGRSCGLWTLTMMGIRRICWGRCIGLR